MRTALKTCIKLSLPVFSLLILAGLLTSCIGLAKRQSQAELYSAAEAVESTPEQALSLLESVKAGLLGEHDYAYYTLVQVRALDKTGTNIAPFEEAVLKAKNFFTGSNNAEKAAFACFELARVYESQERMVKALYNYLLADEWAKVANYNISNFSYSIIPYNIASFYFKDRRYNESLEYLRFALNLIGREQVDYMRNLYVYELMGLNYQYLNLADSSLLYYDKAFEIANTHNDALSKNRIIYNSWNLLYTTKNYQAAEEKSKELLSSFNETNDGYITGLMYSVLAKIYHETDSSLLATEAIYKAIDLLENAESHVKNTLYEQFILIEQNNDDTAKVAHSIQLYNAFKADAEYKHSVELAELEAEKERKLMQGENAYKVLQATAGSRLIARQERKAKHIIVTLLAIASLSIGVVLYYKKTKKQKSTDEQLKEDILLTISYLQSLAMVTDELSLMDDNTHKHTALDMLDDAVTIAKMPQQLHRRYGKLYRKIQASYPSLTRTELELCWIAQTELLAPAEVMRLLGLTFEQFNATWLSINKKIAAERRTLKGIDGFFVKSDDLTI